MKNLKNIDQRSALHRKFKMRADFTSTVYHGKFVRGLFLGRGLGGGELRRFRSNVAIGF